MRLPNKGTVLTKKQQAQNRKNQFLWAEGQQESGGNYHAVNPGSGALGRWQVMPENLPGWAHQCGLPVVSREQYLASATYQDKMVYCILGGYYDHYGAAGAASMWYSGQPNYRATYGDPPVYKYVDDVLAIMGGAPVSGVGASGLSQTGTLGPYLKWGVAPPRPGTESWARYVTSSARNVHSAADTMQSHANTIRRLRITTTGR